MDLESYLQMELAEYADGLDMGWGGQGEGRDKNTSQALMST